MPLFPQQVYVPVVLGTTYLPAFIALWVGVAGSLKVLGLHDGAVCTLPNVPVGFLALPYPVTEVIAAANLSGTATTVNGSPTVTFTVAQTLPQGAALVFSNQLGVVYYLASPMNGATTGTLTTNYTGTGASLLTVSEGTTASGLVGAAAGS